MTVRREAPRCEVYPWGTQPSNRLSAVVACDRSQSTSSDMAACWKSHLTSFISTWPICFTRLDRAMPQRRKNKRARERGFNLYRTYCRRSIGCRTMPARRTRRQPNRTVVATRAIYYCNPKAAANRGRMPCSWCRAFRAKSTPDQPCVA